jgi:hypothetical protein
MSTNSTLQLTSLDFDTLNENFKTFLKAQSTFNDYNFEGSNIKVLLDVMAYNTYLNSFYLNMVSSEMFLDSAQKLDSVVSHAKELNYTPQSSTSAKAILNLTFDTTGLNGSLVIPKGTIFTGTNSNGNFSFTTDSLTTYISTNNTFSVSNLTINEGVYLKDSYIVDYNVENQQYLISNANCDISSAVVTVYETSQSNGSVYTKQATLFGLDNQSNVYFMQAAQNGQYEVVFGDGYFGRKPPNASTVTIDYRVSKGILAEGVSSFSLSDNLGDFNKGTVTVSGIDIIQSAAGGSVQESIEDIRFRAPRYFATQQRAVSTDDYSALVLSEFGGEITDVNVYGGQDLEPKQYGRVVVCVKPNGSTITPNYLKNKITNYLSNYIALPNRVIISDPDYFYIAVDTIVQYTSSSTTKTQNEVKSLVTSGIINFSKTNLEKFQSDFRLSRLTTAIDNIESSITSNDTHVRLLKKITPNLNTVSSFDIKFNNQPNYDGLNKVLTSTSFTYVDDASGVNYSSSYITDDVKGNLIVYTFINNVYTVLNENIGTIDYKTGRVIISKLKTSYYDENINIYMTQDGDVYANQSMVLLIDPSNINVTMLETIR